MFKVFRNKDEILSGVMFEVLGKILGSILGSIGAIYCYNKRTAHDVFIGLTRFRQ